MLNYICAFARMYHKIRLLLGGRTGVRPYSRVFMVYDRA